MLKRFKHIIWLFILQLLLTALIGFAAFQSKMLFNKEKQQVTDARTNIESINSLSEELSSSDNPFLMVSKFPNEFIQEGSNSFTILFHNNTATTQKLVNYFSNIKRYKSTLLIADTLLTSLTNYYQKFEDLRTSNLERGNTNLGLTNNLRKTGWEIIDYVSDYPEIVSIIKELKIAEDSYLDNPTANEFKEINSFIDKTISKVYSIENIEFDQISTVQLLTKLKEYFDDLHDILNRLGYIYSESGYVNDFYNLQTTYQSYLEIYTDQILSITKRFAFYSTIKLYAIWLILAIGFLSIIIFTYKKISDNLKNLAVQTSNLAEGNTTQSDLNKLDFEFAELGETLSSINKKINIQEEFIAKLLNNDFESRLEIKSNTDSFSSKLNDLLDKLKENEVEQKRHADENEIRRYLNEGIAQFGDILRNNSDNLEKLSDEFIKHLVRYLHAVQGGVFLVDEEDEDVLNLTATFAFDRKKYIDKSIRKGDGLVGSCAMEQNTIVMDELPSDYIEITSGLGDSPPNNLILVPCKHEGSLKGVIELASLNKFTKNQVELIELVASNLAATLITVQNNERNSSLLKKSQEQAAEMAEQEEEMRQNMEELKATQEESARREEDVNMVLNALDSAFLVMHYDITGQISQINENLVKFLKVGEKELFGKTHQEVFGDTSVINVEYIKTVMEAGQLDIKEQFIIEDKTYMLHHHLAPLKFESGDTDGVINFISYELIEENH